MFGKTKHRGMRGLLSVVVTMGLLALSGFGGASEGQKASTRPVDKVTQERMQGRFRESSQQFRENKGQWDARAKFFVRAKGVDLWVTENGLVFDHYRSSEQGGVQGRKGSVVGLEFRGASKQPSIQGQRPGRMLWSYANGSKKVSGVRGFGETTTQSIYPGIDLRTYLENGSPRYDLIVAPGADPSVIKMAFRGAESVGVNEKAELEIGTSLGIVKHGKLIAYQMANGRRTPVPVRFDRSEDGTISFALGAYDASKVVVIDPLVYGSYYGGDDGFDIVRSVVADEDGGVYLTGSTQASMFPSIYGPYGFELMGGWDMFVTKFQGDAYSHDYSALVGGSASDIGSFVDIDPFGNVWVAGTTSSYDFPGHNKNVQYLSLTTGPPPASGSFRLTLNGETTAPLPYNSSATQIANALNTLSGVSGVVATAAQNLPDGTIRIQIPLPGLIEVDNTGIAPSEYGIALQSGTVPFLMRFASSLVTVLDPLPTTLLMWGTDRGNGLETPSGMKVIPNDNPAPTDPVEFVIVGNTTAGNPLPELGGAVPLSQDGYILRYTFDGAAFTKTDGRYISGNGSANVITGLAVDRSGQAYVAGTVGYNSNVDTAVFAAFATTGNVFPGGRLLRLNDAFVRKYDRAGTILYSALIGGNGRDSGAGVAVDASGNAYVTGIASSFNFPRTPGVYGENFGPGALVFCTKINLDASQIVYSTHLNTTPPLTVSGIAVDNSGNAYITGTTTFSLTFPTTPGDPNEPTAASFGAVPTTEDGLRLTYTSPLPPELPTDDAYLLVLNANASNLLYGTYIGDNLDEFVYAPYTDRLGDVWVFGYSDSYRYYERVSTTGAVTRYESTGQLADAFLSPFAFKRTGDAFGNTLVPGVLYGLRESPFTPPPTINTLNRRDGFLIKLRLGLPTIGSLVLNPNAVAGGLGASTTGTVNLTLPAPAGGLDVVLTLDNEAATFSGSGFQDTMVLSIPGGSQSANFQVFTNAVTQTTNVNVRATLEGNFVNRVLTVQPWLTQVTVSPNSIVGGNQVTGRVRLFQPAIDDVVVDLSTDNSSLLSFPNGATVTVPAGQDTATFLVDTEGVGVQTVANVTASLLGVGKSQPVTVLTANLVNVTFNPTRVTGGTAATGTVTLDGETGTAFTVDLTIDSGTPGYQIIPTTITFNPGDRSQTFTVQTVYEPVDTQRKITATRVAQGGYSGQSRIGTLFIDASELIAFTIDKTEVNVGEDATGTVSLSKAAGTGGAVVNLSASNSLVTVPATVTIPAGSTTGTFTITTTTGAVLGDQTVDITASRGPVSITRTLTVKSSTLTLSLSPNSVVGGDPSTGTVSLGAAAASDLVVTLGSNNVAASVPATVTILAGASSATFTVTTTAVPSNENADITATAGTLSATATLQIRAVGVVGISFTPPKVRGGTTTTCRITLDSPAPAGGVVVTLSQTNSLVAVIPSSVTVPAGATFIEFTVQTRRVSRTLATLVTATRGATSVSAVLTATR